MKGVVQKWIYKKWPVDVLETIMYFNILAFSAFTWYTLDSDKSPAAVACTSVMITFFLLFSVIAFHVYKYTALASFIMRSEVFKWISAKVKTIRQNEPCRGAQQVNKVKHIEGERNHPTYSVIAIHQPRIIHPSMDEENVTY
jgi:uncharacterized membrane-anchored protein YitT (DUF2179 family)